jgi:5'-methylthioadenosine phosphorylase
VPARANIAALKSLGVKTILAFSAVGSLREEIAPGDFALPTQIIDRTKGIRPASFFDGTNIVAHAAFGDPFTNKLVEWLEVRVKKALEEDGKGVKLHTGKCIVGMEGPQFSTRAESVMYRMWGADVINMSVLPEAKLAREAELGCVVYPRLCFHPLYPTDTESDMYRYALIATATDYDSWRPHSDSITAAEIFKTLKQNADTSRHVAAAVLEDLVKETNLLEAEAGSMKFSIMPRTADLKASDMKRMSFVLPDYFS